MMSRWHKTIAVSVCAIFAVLLVSCEEGVVYDKYVNTDIDGWDKSDIVSFSVPPLKEMGVYNMELGLRTNNLFPFTGVSVVIERNVFPGYRYTADTLRCKLTDERGHIKGHGIGNYQYVFSLDESYFRRGDSLQVTVRHIMRREVLPGISDVGLRITKVK
ncbi:MAG: gliding motility lipoprotein GldH [Prevotella sp.]